MSPDVTVEITKSAAVMAHQVGCCNGLANHRLPGTSSTFIPCHTLHKNTGCSLSQHEIFFLVDGCAWLQCFQVWVRSSLEELCDFSDADDDALPREWDLSSCSEESFMDQGDATVFTRVELTSVSLSSTCAVSGAWDCSEVSPLCISSFYLGLTGKN